MGFIVEIVHSSNTGALKFPRGINSPTDPPTKLTKKKRPNSSALRHKNQSEFTRQNISTSQKKKASLHQIRLHCSNLQDNKALFRSDFFPGLGWMLPRRVWEELSPAWPDAYWDDWLRDPQRRRDRQFIRPEVCRTYHFGQKVRLCFLLFLRLIGFVVEKIRSITCRTHSYSSYSLLRCCPPTSLKGLYPTPASGCVHRLSVAGRACKEEKIRPRGTSPITCPSRPAHGKKQKRGD